MEAKTKDLWVFIERYLLKQTKTALPKRLALSF